MSKPDQSIEHSVVTREKEIILPKQTLSCDIKICPVSTYLWFSRNIFTIYSLFLSPVYLQPFHIVLYLNKSFITTPQSLYISPSSLWPINKSIVPICRPLCPAISHFQRPSPNFTLLSSLYCSIPTPPLYYHPFDFSVSDFLTPLSFSWTLNQSSSPVHPPSPFILISREKWFALWGLTAGQ